MNKTQNPRFIYKHPTDIERLINAVKLVYDETAKNALDELKQRFFDLHVKETILEVEVDRLMVDFPKNKPRTDAQALSLANEYFALEARTFKYQLELIAIEIDGLNFLLTQSRLLFPDATLTDDERVYLKTLEARFLDDRMGKYQQLLVLSREHGEASEKVHLLYRERLDHYQSGPKARVNARWELARQYLIEERPLNITLQDARRAAANRAGICVEDRQLIKKLPWPPEK